MEETGIPLVALCASSSITIFAYYAIKYRKFIKDQASRNPSLMIYSTKRYIMGFIK